MERAQIIARVSSTGQREASQIPIGRAWCAEHGYAEAGEPLTYRKSAKTDAYLAELEKGVRMVEANRADVLVLVRLDRLTRQGVEVALNLRRRVLNAGGRIEFARDRKLNGADSAEVEEAWANRAIAARVESELRMQRIEEGYDEVIANGAASTKPRYGWQLTGYTQNKRWTAVENRKTVVVGIMERVADGMSLRAVREWAMTQDDTVKFWQDQLRSIIGDDAYSTGIVETTVNGKPYRFNVPPLVPLELQQRAKASLGAPKRFKATPRTKFTGIVFCGLCGGSMTRTSPNQLGYRYWRCRNQECKRRVRDDALLSAAHEAMSSSKAELIDEVLIREPDTREVRRAAAMRDLKGLSAKYGADIDGMIQRAGELKAELAAIGAERPPRGHVEGKPTGVTLAKLYGSTEDVETVNANLRKYNVRVTVWKGEPSNPEEAIRMSMNTGPRSAVIRRDGLTVMTHWGLLG